MNLLLPFNFSLNANSSATAIFRRKTPDKILKSTIIVNHLCKIYVFYDLNKYIEWIFKDANLIGDRVSILTTDHWITVTNGNCPA